MRRQSKKETVRDQQLTTDVSPTADSKADYCNVQTQPWPFDDEGDKEMFYIINGKKMVKMYYANGNFQCQLIKRTDEMIDIDTILNSTQFRTLLDVYSELLSTLSIAFYKGEKTYVTYDLTDGICVSAASSYFCLDVREFCVDNKTENPLPTRNGVSYNINEVNPLHDILKAIKLLNKC